MKKILALASVGAFVLSLSGASLAQEKTPAPATPPATEQIAPTSPAMETPAATPKEEAAAKKAKAAKVAKAKKAKAAKAAKAKKAKAAKKAAEDAE